MTTNISMASENTADWSAPRSNVGIIKTGANYRFAAIVQRTHNPAIIRHSHVCG